MVGFNVWLLRFFVFWKILVEKYLSKKLFLGVLVWCVGNYISFCLSRISFYVIMDKEVEEKLLNSWKGKLYRRKEKFSLNFREIKW